MSNNVTKGIISSSSFITAMLLVTFVAIRFQFLGLESGNNFRNIMLALFLGIPASLVFFDYLLKPRISKKIYCLLTAFFPLVAIYLYWVIASPQKITAISAVSKLCLLAFWTIYIMKSFRRDSGLLFIQSIILFVLGINFVAWLIGGMELPMTGLFRQKNMLPYLGFLGSFFLIQVPSGLPKSLYPIHRLFCYSGILASIGISLLSSARIAFISFIFVLFIYKVWPFFSRNLFRYRLVIILMFLLIMLSTLFLASFKTMLFLKVDAELINEIAKDYSGRSMTSGRDIIWPGLIKAMAEKPLIGWGPHVEPSVFFAGESARSNPDWSAHSSYLQVGFQAGIIGLISFCFMLYKIWMLFFKERHNKRVRLGGAFFLTILLIQGFTVSLIQENLTLGLLMWTIVGYTLKHSKNKQLSIANT